MSKIAFVGNALAVIRDFPAEARRQIGFSLDRLQNGLEPASFKLLPVIGAGVAEIKTTVQSGEYRTIYTLKFEGQIYVLHAFRKKTQKTPKREIALIKKRLSEIKA